MRRPVSTTDSDLRGTLGASLLLSLWMAKGAGWSLWMAGSFAIGSAAQNFAFSTSLSRKMGKALVDLDVAIVEEQEAATAEEEAAAATEGTEYAGCRFSLFG
jgi:hypothetical protein